MNVAVLGAGGYIGSVLVPKLLKLNHRVLAIDRFFFGREVLKSHPNLEVITEDTRFLNGNLFQGINIVIDLAGISNDPACDLNENISWGINYTGLCNCVDQAKKYGVSHYIYSSSCSVYGSSKDEWVDESSPTHPVSLYAELKLKCEDYLQKSSNKKFNVTMLRNSTVYGLSPRMRFDLIINLMTLHAFKYKEIHVLGGGSQWRPLIHIDDLCNAFIEVLNKQKESNGEIFNVGCTTENYQVITIANLVKSTYPNTQISIAPDDEDKRSYRVNCDKIQHVLNYKINYYPLHGIAHVIEALKFGYIKEDITTNTVNYYKYLLEADKLLNKIKLNGVLL
jgi:nucleoside-diphosphate-sugar epimerase